MIQVLAPAYQHILLAGTHTYFHLPNSSAAAVKSSTHKHMLLFPLPRSMMLLFSCCWYYWCWYCWYWCISNTSMHVMRACTNRGDWRYADSRKPPILRASCSHQTAIFQGLRRHSFAQ